MDGIPSGAHGTATQRFGVGKEDFVPLAPRVGADEYAGRALPDGVECGMPEFATAKDMDIRGPVGDWHALRSNLDYKADWRAHGGAPSVAGSAGFDLRDQSEADLEAARWGLLAWEDPRERSAFKPFWIDEKMLVAVVAEPGDTVGMLARATGMRVSGLRLLDGALVLKVKR